MKFLVLFTILLSPFGCSNETSQKMDAVEPKAQNFNKPADSLSYDELKGEIKEARLTFKRKYQKAEALETDSARDEISRFWVKIVSGDLFQQWKGTPWDFNGTTNVPRNGNIACGYFVTTILADMGVPLNRRQLSTCPSSEMMKKLVPGRPLINLSGLSFRGFCDFLKNYKPGVFIIGLDYHTGIIVIDTSATWFIHSYYAKNIGVIKEITSLSPALQSSKTKWMVPLTADRGFIKRWMENMVL
jgi:hypothetical protein